MVNDSSQIFDICPIAYSVHLCHHIRKMFRRDTYFSEMRHKSGADIHAGQRTFARYFYRMSDTYFMLQDNVWYSSFINMAMTSPWPVPFIKVQDICPVPCFMDISPWSCYVTSNESKWRYGTSFVTFAKYTFVSCLIVMRTPTYLIWSQKQWWRSNSRVARGFEQWVCLLLN